MGGKPHGIVDAEQGEYFGGGSGELCQEQPMANCKVGLHTSFRGSGELQQGPGKCKVVGSA